MRDSTGKSGTPSKQATCMGPGSAPGTLDTGVCPPSGGFSRAPDSALRLPPLGGGAVCVGPSKHCGRVQSSRGRSGRGLGPTRV